MMIYKVKMIRKSGGKENFEVTSFSTAAQALKHFKKLADTGERMINTATVAEGFDTDTVKVVTDNKDYPSYLQIESTKLDNESLELRLEYEEIDGGIADWLTPTLLKDIINKEKEAETGTGKNKPENQTTFWPGEGGK